MGKLPSFQFYPGDWLKDPQLRMASLESRAIWFDLICAMWEAPERGVIEGTPAQFCKLVGCSTDEFSLFLTEAKSLRFANVREMSADPQGAIRIECRRVLRDEKQRKDWAKQKANQRGRAESAPKSADCPPSVREVSAQCPPVSSSSSSSSKRESTPEGRKRKPETTWPEGFTLTEDLRAYAQKRGVDPESEFEKFHLHAIDKSPTHKDWAVAFQRWILNEVGYRNRNGNAKPHQAPRAIPPTSPRL